VANWYDPSWGTSNGQYGGCPYGSELEREDHKMRTAQFVYSEPLARDTPLLNLSIISAIPTTTFAIADLQREFLIENKKNWET
jgi:hypothetical protein